MNEYPQREREVSVEAWLRGDQGFLTVSGDLRHRVLRQTRRVERHHAIWQVMLVLCFVITGASQWIIAQLPSGARVRYDSEQAMTWANALSTLPRAETGYFPYSLSWSGPVRKEGGGTANMRTESQVWRLVRARVLPGLGGSLPNFVDKSGNHSHLLK